MQQYAQTKLVTGANRGLGKAFVAHFLLEPHTFVAAGVRDPTHETSKALVSLPRAPGTQLVVIKLDSTSDEDHATAITALTNEHGLQRLDVVISNAGICHLSRLDTTPLADLREHVEVNVIAVMRLFQATQALLKASPAPKFLFIGSAAGSITAMPSVAMPHGAYAASKAMANALVRKLQMENEWLVAMTVHPGWARTDMGNDGARYVGLEEAEVEVEESVRGVLGVLDKADNKTVLGPFLDYSGAEFPW